METDYGKVAGISQPRVTVAFERALAGLPSSQAERIRRWSAGAATADVVRPRKEWGLGRGFLRFLIVAGVGLEAIGGAMLGIGKLAGSKLVSDLSILPLWLGAGPLLALAVLFPFLLGLRWLQGRVEAKDPFWYFLDDELFAIYDTRGGLYAFERSKLSDVHWSITRPAGLHPELVIVLASNDGTEFQHRRTLFVAMKECAALCERLKAAIVR